MNLTTPSPESEKLSVDERIKLVPTSFLHRMSATWRNITATLFCRSQIRVVCVLLIGTAVAAGCYAYLYWKAGRCVRTITLSRNSFRADEPVVIRSRVEFWKFVGSQGIDDWRLDDAINTASIDFEKETLVLICTWGYDGRVGLSMPMLHEKRLRYTIWRKGSDLDEFDNNITMQCFALIVLNDSVDDVDFRLAGEQNRLVILDRPHPN